MPLPSPKQSTDSRIPAKPATTGLMVFGTAWLSLTLAAVAPPVSAALPDLGDPADAVLSQQAEHKMGEQTMHQLRAAGAYLNDPEVNAYLNQLGYRLLSAAPEIKGRYSFFAVPAHEINAFALPGGFIGVNTGLILAARSESELAAVLAHEITHVSQRHIARQMAGQSNSQFGMLAAMIAGIIAAQSGNNQAASAVITTATAAQAQSQIDYTRDHEREADRIGFVLLDQADFDPSAMATFFQRLQQASRLYDNRTPGWLRSHPLTHERIAEAQDRAASRPYRQLPDSPDFQLIRTLLDSYDGEPHEAIARSKARLDEQPDQDSAVARYGHAAALLRGKDYRAAQMEITRLDRDGVRHPMIEALAGQVLLQSGQLAAARARYEAALSLYPDHLQLVYDYPRVLLQDRQFSAAATFTEMKLQRWHRDATLHQLAAEAYANLGKHTMTHFHQGEHYAATGNLRAAVEQFTLAIRSNDGAFRDLLVTENRLKEIRGQMPAGADPNKKPRRSYGAIREAD